MASAPIRMNVNAAPIEAADNQKLLGVRDDGELVQVEVDLGVGGVPPGAQGQLVGYDASGKPVPVAAPAVTDPFDPTPLENRLSQAEQAIADAVESIPSEVDLTPITGRLTALEDGLSQVPEPYDDTALVQAVAAQNLRLAAAEAAIEDIPELADLAPLIGRVSAVEDALADLPGPVDLAPLTGRVSAVEDALADLPGPVDLAPLTGRVSAVEAALEDIAAPYDDTEIRNELAQLTSRVDAIDGGFINRPPTSSPIPAQSLTVGTEFAANFSGYFSDPDGDVLNALEVTGSLPPGIEQSGFAFTGTPTQVGNFTVTLTVEDLYGASANRTIAWTVASVPGAVTTITAAPGGFAVQNPGSFPDYSITPALGGFTLEIA